MKTWSALQNAWLGLRRAHRLGWLAALVLGALLLTLYLQVLHQGMARADQQRLGQRTSANTLSVQAVAPPR